MIGKGEDAVEDIVDFGIRVCGDRVQVGLTCFSSLRKVRSRWMDCTRFDTQVALISPFFLRLDPISFKQKTGKQVVHA